jgi:hypothetical protein
MVAGVEGGGEGAGVEGGVEGAGVERGARDAVVIGVAGLAGGRVRAASTTPPPRASATARTAPHAVMRREPGARAPAARGSEELTPITAVVVGPVEPSGISASTGRARVAAKGSTPEAGSRTVGGGAVEGGAGAVEGDDVGRIGGGTEARGT